MEIHLTEAEVLRILMEHVNSFGCGVFDAANVQHYPTFRVVLKAAENDEAQ